MYFSKSIFLVSISTLLALTNFPTIVVPLRLQNHEIATEKFAATKISLRLLTLNPDRKDPVEHVTEVELLAGGEKLAEVKCVRNGKVLFERDCERIDFELAKIAEFWDQKLVEYVPEYDSRKDHRPYVQGSPWAGIDVLAVLTFEEAGTSKSYSLKTDHHHLNSILCQNEVTKKLLQMLNTFGDEEKCFTSGKECAYSDLTIVGITQYKRSATLAASPISSLDRGLFPDAFHPKWWREQKRKQEQEQNKEDAVESKKSNEVSGR